MQKLALIIAAIITGMMTLIKDAPEKGNNSKNGSVYLVANRPGPRIKYIQVEFQNLQEIACRLVRGSGISKPYTRNKGIP